MTALLCNDLFARGRERGQLRLQSLPHFRVFLIFGGRKEAFVDGFLAAGRVGLDDTQHPAEAPRVAPPLSLRENGGMKWGSGDAEERQDEKNDHDDADDVENAIHGFSPLTYFWVFAWK